MNIRQFTSDEISEINSYVVNQIPQSILPQLFIVTEEPIKKVRIFITVYRIVEATKDYVENEDTRNKLNKMLKEVREAYVKLYKIQINFENSLNLSKHRKEKALKFHLFKNNKIINNFINNFIVFAEKQELLETEKVTGINIANEEGIDLYKKLIKPLK